MTDFDWMQKKRPVTTPEQPPKRDLSEDWEDPEPYKTMRAFVEYPYTSQDLPGYEGVMRIPTMSKQPDPPQRNILEIIRRCERMLDSGDTDLQTDAPSIILDIVTEFREEIEPMFDGLMECESTGDLIDSATGVVCWWQEKVDGLEEEDG